MNCFLTPAWTWRAYRNVPDLDRHDSYEEPGMSCIRARLERRVTTRALSAQCKPRVGSVHVSIAIEKHEILDRWEYRLLRSILVVYF